MPMKPEHGLPFRVAVMATKASMVEHALARDLLVMEGNAAGCTQQEKLVAEMFLLWNDLQKQVPDDNPGSSSAKRDFVSLSSEVEGPTSTSPAVAQAELDRGAAVHRHLERALVYHCAAIRMFSRAGQEASVARHLDWAARTARARFGDSEPTDFKSLYRRATDLALAQGLRV